MSFTLLGILNAQAAGGAVTFWLSTLGGVSNDEAESVAIDSAGNVYVVGLTVSTGAGVRDLLLAKYDSSGTVQYQRVLGGAGNEFGNAVAIDSADNVYVAGTTDSTGAGGIDLLLAKYNSSGTIQYQRVLGGSVTDRAYSVAIDSAGNVYVVGSTNSTGAGGTDLLLAKYNSSGTIQFQRILGGNNNEIGYSVAIDSADNVYIFGFTQTTGAGGSDFLLAKYNSSGTIQFQRILGASNFEFGYSVAIDSADNVYVVGQSGSDDFFLAKYNSSGTVQYQRVLGGSSLDRAYSVAIDSADNVYVFGLTLSTGAGGSDFLLAKYNSSGTIQFQRTLGGTANDEGHSVAIDSADNVYIFGTTSSTGAGGQDFLLAKLPNDGSLEGTYALDGNNITYQASTLTSQTGGLTAATPSLTSATSTLTSATASLTSASASLTVVTLEI